MKMHRSLSAVSAVAVMAGLYAVTASAAPPLGNTERPSIRLVMHDDMMPGMKGGGTGGQMPGMKGGGTGGQMPPAGQAGAAVHSPAPSPPGAHAPADMPAGARGHGPMDTMIDLPTDRIEGRIAFLHAELRIAEAQMPAWNEFAGVMRANAKRMGEAQGTTAQGSTSAIERLDSHERWLTARLESVRALKAGYAKLYAVLDESQRKVGDQLVVHQMGIR